MKGKRFNNLSCSLIAVSISIFSAVLPSPAIAQVKEDKPVNLKVLPFTITDGELDKLMGDYSRALGVRCNFCHADPNSPGGKNDFAADWNPNKLTARSMIQMVSTINSSLLKNARQFNKDIGEISCVTCHHGAAKIDLLENLLYTTYQKNGLDASFKEYENLKKQYYGSFTYDFSSRTLINFATLASAAGKSEDAASIAKKNAELFPDAALSYLFLGNESSKKGSKDEAIKYFEKALQIDPNNRNATQQLRRLKQ